MLLRLFLKEVNAPLTKRNSDLNSILFKGEFFRGRQEVRYNLEFTQVFISVFSFHAHKSFYPSANSGSQSKLSLLIGEYSRNMSKYTYNYMYF